MVFGAASFTWTGAPAWLRKCFSAWPNSGHRGANLSATQCGCRSPRELPANFRLPGKQALTEPILYHVLSNSCKPLTQTGAAVCGSGAAQPWREDPR